ncbi:MAG TPA: hypothetical protein VEW42_05140 [Candidatus Eisenbacteria bacterium]|nr:hypothetical protein [Candidatus Eisenbacteria bacterium]
MTSASNQKTSINQLLFRNLYYRYQRFVTPGITIGVCLLLFWFVVIPQMQNWFAIRDELGVDQQNLQIMHQNLSLITSFDNAKLDTTLHVATDALPTEKDFAGILSSLQNAAAVAGISLGDYSFQLGDLSGLNAQGQAAQTPVQLTLNLKGSLDNTRAFITQLKSQLPLSDVTSVSLSSNSSVTVTIIFYYAAVPKISFKDTVLLPILSTADKKVLEDLSLGSTEDTPISSASAVPSPTVVLPSPTNIPTVLPTLSATSSAQ